MIAFVISGKSPKTMAGGLGAYAYNAAYTLNQLGYRVVIVGFSAKDETIDLGFARLVHFRSKYSGLLGLASVFMAGEFARVMERERGGASGEVLVYSAGIWGLGGENFKRRMRPYGVRVRTWVGYFSTFRHEYRGHVLGAPASDYGLGVALFFRLLALFVRIAHSPFEHRLLRSVDRVIVHYESTRRILLGEVRGIDPRKIRKIPYCVEMFERSETEGGERAKAGERRGEEVRVTALCRQDPRKGLNSYLKAIRILKERGVRARFTLAGSGIFLRENQALARRLGISSDVEFLGFVESTEALLAQSDIYVLPSVEEGSGAISLLEAMKQGVAIVTTRCDGISEDFIDRETALLVSSGDERALADALAELVRDPMLRSRLADAARSAYPERFSRERMRESIEDLMKEQS